MLLSFFLFNEVPQMYYYILTISFWNEAAAAVATSKTTPTLSSSVSPVVKIGTKYCKRYEYTIHGHEYIDGCTACELDARVCVCVCTVRLSYISHTHQCSMRNVIWRKLMCEHFKSIDIIHSKRWYFNSIKHFRLLSKRLMPWPTSKPIVFPRSIQCKRSDKTPK